MPAHRSAVSASPLSDICSRTYSLQKREGRMLLVPACFVDHHRQPFEFIANVRCVQPLDPRRQNRCLDHGVLRPVESEKIAHPAVFDDACNNRGPLLTIIDRIDAERMPATRIRQNRAVRRPSQANKRGVVLS